MVIVSGWSGPNLDSVKLERLLQQRQRQLRLAGSPIRLTEEGHALQRVGMIGAELGLPDLERLSSSGRAKSALPASRYALPRIANCVPRLGALLGQSCPGLDLHFVRYARLPVRISCPDVRRRARRCDGTHRSVGYVLASSGRPLPATAGPRPAGRHPCSSRPRYPTVARVSGCCRPSFASRPLSASSSSGIDLSNCFAAPVSLARLIMRCERVGMVGAELGLASLSVSSKSGSARSSFPAATIGPREVVHGCERVGMVGAELGFAELQRLLVAAAGPSPASRQPGTPRRGCSCF